MKKILSLLILLLPVILTANVIGPNSDGVYKVDQWGSKVEPTEIPEFKDYFPETLKIKSNFAVL